MFDEFRDSLLKLKRTGGHNIFAASLLNKLISFVNSIIVARVLSKNDFGLYSYCYSILQFFILLRGLGLNNSMLQFCSEKGDENHKRSYYSFSLRYGTLISIVISVLCVIFTFVFNFRIVNSDYYLRLLSFIPVLMFIRENYSMILRSKFRNKQYALTTNIDTASNLLFPVAGSLICGLKGYVYGLYIAYLVSIIIERRFVRNDIISFIDVKKIEKDKIKMLLSYGIVCCLTNTVSQSLYLVDTFLVGTILQDSSVLADYKIATGIPFAFYFIPTSLMVFITPYYASHNKELAWIRSKTRIIIMVNGLVSTMIGIVLLLTSSPAIPAIYGSQYATAVPCFRVLVISYVVSSVIKIPFGNILVMLRMVKYNLFTSCIEGLLNILFDIILIKYYGPIGAAYATLLVASVSSLFAFIGYLFFIKRGINH